MSYWSSVKRTFKHIRIIPKWKGFKIEFKWWFIIPWIMIINFVWQGLCEEHWEITLFTWKF